MSSPVLTDFHFLRELNNQKPVTRPKEYISEYIEGKRILPPNTPFPGLWENKRTPYAIEIMDNMSPWSPIQRTVIMKGAQLGLTAAAENVVAYWMDECPAEILFISATEGLLEKWATKRLDPLIDSCDFRHKIFAQTQNKKSRRLGDKVFVKEYIGGTLDMASAQSASSLRSDSKRILIRDEVDGSPPQLKTGEGNWMNVSEARTRAWGNRKKMLDISTPALLETSLIFQAYEVGDCRWYMVPCIHCGHYQFLIFDPDDTKEEKGLIAERDNVGNIKWVFYRCENPKCQKELFNNHKTEMLANGYWKPTKQANKKYYRSYWINSLYSPVGMLSWEEFYQQHEEAKHDEDEMRSFINLSQGWPFTERGSRPNLQKVIENRGTYKSGTIPEGVLFLTMGIDVQRGNKNDAENPPRLEYEIVGHGIAFKTWSIKYGRFTGDIDDINAGAWLKLNEFAEKGGLSYSRRDGIMFNVELIFIDSGDGESTDKVYDFCASWSGTFPSKGWGNIMKKKNEKKGEVGDAPGGIKRYRPADIGGGTRLYEISTNYYKNRIYSHLKIARENSKYQKAGFCDFPRDYDDRYFAMLTAEEKKSDGSFYAGGRRNEALDCRVMACCAADVHLDAKVLLAKANAKANGVSDTDILKIDHRFVLSYMEEKLKFKN